MSMHHTTAFNLARRHSSKIENDMLQESFCDDINDADSPILSEHHCSSLFVAANNKPDINLPVECKQFSSIQAAIKRRDSSNVDANIAFAGMHAGEAQMAQAARARGNLAPAQIKRRLTNRSKAAEPSWFH